MIDHLHLADLTQHLSSVEEMAEYLRDRGHSSAAARTDALACVMGRVEDLQKELWPVWRAADRLLDSKCGPEHLAKVVAEWETLGTMSERNRRLAKLHDDYAAARAALEGALAEESA